MSSEVLFSEDNIVVVESDLFESVVLPFNPSEQIIVIIDDRDETRVVLNEIIVVLG